MKLFHDLPKPTAWPPPRTPGGVWAALDYVRNHDPIGDQVHRGLAMLYCLMLPFSTALSGITFGMVLFYAVVRLPHTWRCYPALLRVPVLWAMAGFMAWQLVSLAWSNDVAQGIDEVGTLRVILTPLMLWPVIHHAQWFIGAALAGVLGVQIVQALQLTRVIEGYGGGRLSAFLHPIQTGAWCVAAMCWHLAAAARTRGPWRIICVAGALLAGLGLIGTASRGPWLAGAVAAPACMVWIAWRTPGARRLLAISTLVGIVAVSGVVMLAGDALRDRVATGWREMAGAAERGLYWESAGLRVGLAGWSIEAWRESPVVGHGSGGFQRAVDRLPGFHQVRREAYLTLLRAIPDYERAARGDVALSELDGYKSAVHKGRRRDQFLRPEHAHSAYLHTLVTGGAVGAAALVIMLGLGLRAAWRSSKSVAGHLFRDGTPFVIMSWLIGAMFDTYHLNGHLLGMFALAVTVSLPRGGERSAS